MEIDYQFLQSIPEKPNAGVVIPWLHQWNGTGSQLVSNHNRPFQALEACSRLTCLDQLTHHHSHPPVVATWVGPWVTTLLGLRTVPFWIPVH